jgi:hypothetical protein
MHAHLLVHKQAHRGYIYAQYKHNRSPTLTDRYRFVRRPCAPPAEITPAHRCYDLDCTTYIIWSQQVDYPLWLL